MSGLRVWWAGLWHREPLVSGNGEVDAIAEDIAVALRGEEVEQALRRAAQAQARLREIQVTLDILVEVKRR